jgi:hypothetical protein
MYRRLYADLATQMVWRDLAFYHRQARLYSGYGIRRHLDIACRTLVHQDRRDRAKSLTLSSENIDVYTPYNYAYHGYWVNDPLTLNPRFGTSDDLMALSTALHNRGMYFMVDIVVNNVPALSINTSQSAAALQADNTIWSDPSYYHEQCWIDYNNQTSIEYW